MAKMYEMILQQLRIFMISAAYGAGLGLWYELFRMLRKQIRHSDFQVHCEDICYISFAMGSFFFLMQRLHYGKIRMYMVFGIVIGLLIYYKILYSFIHVVLEQLFAGLFRFFGKMKWMIGYPVRLFLNYLVKMLKNMWRTVKIVKSRF